MFLDETTTADYAIDTLDPVALNTHIASGAYHYQYVFTSAPSRSGFSELTFFFVATAFLSFFRRVCLEQKYTRQSCPEYLTPEGFALLKANDGEVMNSFRLHTDSIINVMKQLGPDSLTVAVLMDLQDCELLFIFLASSASSSQHFFLDRVPQLARPNRGRTRQGPLRPHAHDPHSPQGPQPQRSRLLAFIGPRSLVPGTLPS